MMKQEQAQELTRKIKRMGEENQVEDEWENANKVSGLGFKINHKLFGKKPKNLIDPNKNFFKLDGNRSGIPEPTLKSSKNRKLIKKKNVTDEKNGERKNKIRFVKRDKRKKERRAGKSKGRRFG